MRSSVLVALICTVVVLAGCQFGGDGGATTTRDPFGVPGTSPPSTPASTTTPDGIDVPGLTGEGVTDPNDLASAHEASLQGDSYTLRRTVTLRFANGTLRTHRTVRAEFGSDGESYRFRTTTEGIVPNPQTSPPIRVEQWSNGSASFVAVTEANETTYLSELGGRVFVRQYDRFLVLFNAVETELSGRTADDGTTLYRVESTGVPRPDQIATGWVFRERPRVTNVSLVAWITERGTVRRSRLTYVATLDGTAIHVTETHRVTGVGTTTIERPAWLPAAINRTGSPQWRGRHGPPVDARAPALSTAGLTPASARYPSGSPRR